MPDRRRRVAVDPPRGTAYDVLKAVRVDDAYANLVLPTLIARDGLTGRDAAFATELASGAIRGRGLYEPVIRSCLDKPRLEAKVLDALLLGAHQLLAMRVPDHAAISTTVDLVRGRVGSGPAGLVNAVLRKVAAHDRDEWVRQVAPGAANDPVGHASVAHSHPRWVVEGLREALAATGAADELDDLLAADNAPPGVTLVARPGLVRPGELPGEPGRWSPYAVHLPGGAPGEVPAVADGRAGVQDEGSQVVALLAAAAPVEGRDDAWLDMCAGPGGKAALLAALAAQRGARLLAAELQPHRAALVARGTRAVAAGVSGVVAADGRRPAWRDGSFDRVLLDVPCSGLGALRRRPESRWRRRPGDLTGLVALQRELLDSALDAIRPGGVVTYATCSPLLPETVDVVSDVLERRDDVEVVPAAGLLPALLEAHGPQPGSVQLWPHRHGTDAMFVTVLRRAE